MLLNGFNHVAVLTADTARFVTFYRDVFDAEVVGEMETGDGGRLTFVRVGDASEFNVFEVSGNTEAKRQTPMFGRGRIDHLGLQAASLDAFEEIRRRWPDFHVDLDRGVRVNMANVAGYSNLPFSTK